MLVWVFVVLAVVISIGLLMVWLYKPSAANPTTDLIPYRIISQRTQWNANYGYCGEISFVAAAMYYGMYMSQYDVRAFTSPTGTQRNSSDQVLLGDESTIKAARLFQFTYEQWDRPAYAPDSSAFVTWISRHTNQGNPVFLGIYNSNTFLDVDFSGDSVYDHIVSCFECEPTYFSFNDNDQGSYPDPTNLSKQPYMYTYTFPAAIRNRTHAYDAPSLYSLPMGVMNYGVAITGLTAVEPLLVRIQLTTNAQEEAVMTDHSNVRPPSNEMPLVIYLYHLKPHVMYHLYKYNRPERVPLHHFNQSYAMNPSSATRRELMYTTVTKVTTVTDTIQSSDIAFYRCVPSYAS